MNMNNAYSVYSRLGHLFLEADFTKRADTARETRKKARVGLRRDVATRMGGKKTILPTNTRRDIGMQQVAARDFRDAQKPKKPDEVPYAKYRTKPGGELRGGKPKKPDEVPYAKWK